jgi:hypothetical protein
VCRVRLGFVRCVEIAGGGPRCSVALRPQARAVVRKTQKFDGWSSPLSPDEICHRSTTLRFIFSWNSTARDMPAKNISVSHVRAVAVWSGADRYLPATRTRRVLRKSNPRGARSLRKPFGPVPGRSSKKSYSQKFRRGDVAKGVPVSPKIGRITFDDAAKDLEAKYMRMSESRSTI